MQMSRAEPALARAPAGGGRVPAPASEGRGGRGLRPGDQSRRGEAAALMNIEAGGRRACAVRGSRAVSAPARRSSSGPGEPPRAATVGSRWQPGRRPPPHGEYARPRPAPGGGGGGCGGGWGGSGAHGSRGQRGGRRAAGAAGPARGLPAGAEEADGEPAAGRAPG